MNKLVLIGVFSVFILGLLLIPQSSHAYYASSTVVNKYSSTVTTNQKTYGLGETIEFSGIVKPYEKERKLSIIVKDTLSNIVIMKTVPVNADGTFVFSFTDTANWKNGLYNVSAQYGYSEVDIGTTTFTLDPAKKVQSALPPVTPAPQPTSDEKLIVQKETKNQVKSQTKSESKKETKSVTVVKKTVKKTETKAAPKPDTPATPAAAPVTTPAPATTPSTAPSTTPSTAPAPVDPVQEKLDACKTKETPREQYECQKAAKAGAGGSEFKAKATATKIGPVTFYYAGAKVESSGGKDIVNLRFLVENTGSNENISMLCTGPIACNYDISDGTTTFKYAANDFTNGNIVLKPGNSRMMNILFGPAIGYGSYIDFKFDSSKQYKFNVHEPWGSGSIPLNLK